MANAQTFTRKSIKPLVGSIAALLLCGHAPVHAAGPVGTSATWNASTVDNNFNNDANWTPSAPNSSTDTGTFNTSTTTNLNVQNFFNNLGGIIFNQGASAYTINLGGNNMQFFGNGITNNSGKTQIINVGTPNGGTGTLDFFNTASAGAKTLITVFGGGSGGEGGAIHFWNNSTAGGATLISTGGGGTFFRNGVDVNGGGIYFEDNSTGGTAAVKVYGNGFLDISNHNAGSVTIGSLEGTGNVYLGSNNLAVGSNNQNTIFRGVIQDGGEGSPFKGLPSQGRGLFPFFGATGGSLTKVGTGILDLTGINTYTGNTVVAQGTLLVDGAIASPQTFVQPGATLGGSGFIGGTVYNDGFVSPGDSPGTLTLKGNYYQYSDGTLVIQIASKSVYDRLVVGGNAVIGGTLDVQALPGAKFKRGQEYMVLSSGGGVSGTFSNVIVEGNNTLLDFKVIYQGTDVMLESTLLPFGSLKGLTPNQTAIAGDLDRLANDHRANRLINFLINEPLTKLPNDFDKLAPEEFASIFNIGTSFDNVQGFNLQRRTEGVRSGQGGFSASGFQTAGSGPYFSGGLFGAAGPNGNDGKDVKEDVPVSDFSNRRWGTFITGVGEWVGVGDDFNSRGYDITTGGFTLGVDYRVCPNFAVGLMAGYVGTGVDLNNGGRVFVNGGKLGVYATCFENRPDPAPPTMSKDSSKDGSKEAPAPAGLLAKGWYADVAVTGGYSSYDVRRAGLEGTARGDTDGGDLNVLFGAGYDFKLGGFTFGPTGSFNYTYVGLNNFTETGSLAPLHFPSQGQESIRTAFGAKASYDWKLGGVLIKPELRAAWQHEYGQTAYEIDSSFANGAGSGFTTNGPRIGRDSLLLGAGFAIMLNERCSTYFYYDGELGRTRYDAQNVSGGFRLAF